MSDQHSRYGLCFTRCVHVWEGEGFASDGVLDFYSSLPHGGFYYVPATLHKHWELGGLVYPFGESTETPLGDVAELAGGDEPQAPTLEEIQMCFCMDCTGSMGKWIDTAKKHVISMADSIKKDAGSIPVQVSFVCYRDFDSGRDNIKSVPFTERIESIKDFVATLKAQGGDDAPEDMAGGMRESLSLQWKPGAKKFCVIVADAPCHGGTRYHDCRTDKFPNGGEPGLPDQYLEQMKNQGIQLIFVRINETTDKMVSVFRQTYDAGGQKLIVVDLSAKGTEGFQAAITAEVVANLG